MYNLSLQEVSRPSDVIDLRVCVCHQQVFVISVGIYCSSTGTEKQEKTTFILTASVTKYLKLFHNEHFIIRKKPFNISNLLNNNSYLNSDRYMENLHLHFIYSGAKDLIACVFSFHLFYD